MKLYDPAESRKLSGLIIGLSIGVGSILILAIIAIPSIAIWGLPESLFATLGALMTSIVTLITGSHQVAQSAADRSSNYPLPAPPNPSSSSMPSASDLKIP